MAGAATPFCSVTAAMVATRVIPAWVRRVRLALQARVGLCSALTGRTVSTRPKPRAPDDHRILAVADRTSEMESVQN